MLPKSALGTPTLGTDLRPETFLAGLPRVVRVADEARWRGQAAVATTVVVVAFWLLSWWAGEPINAGLTILAAAAVGVPTLLTCALTGGRRLREGLVHAAQHRALALEHLHPPVGAMIVQLEHVAREREVGVAVIPVAHLLHGQLERRRMEPRAPGGAHGPESSGGRRAGRVLHR